MCVILDNNQVRDYRAGKRHLQGIIRSISGGKARLVHGGKLTREYMKTPEFFSHLMQLQAAGRARILDESQVDEMERHLKVEGVLCSDDPHVIAVARVGFVRLLISQDANLIADFTNPQLISAPRGKVFKRSPDHDKLIQQACKSVHQRN